MRIILICSLFFLTLGFIRQAQAQERIETKRGYSSIVLDYYHGKSHVSRYRHFLSNHPRYKRYSGHVRLLDKHPQISIWLNHKQEATVVYIGSIRYRRKSIGGRIICDYFTRKLDVWRKRLNFDRYIKKAMREKRRR
ncbi:MAG: hypothetical protein U9P90_00250 [Patescibacteria group bacterium]|nr:hypothetical protein [Patescibacteria group bacterium]